jgi:hypothetical protein
VVDYWRLAKTRHLWVLARWRPTWDFIETERFRNNSDKLIIVNSYPELMLALGQTLLWIRRRNQNVKLLFISDQTNASVKGERWCHTQRGGDWGKKDLIPEDVKSKDLPLPARLMAGWPAVLLVRRLSGGLAGRLTSST